MIKQFRFLFLILLASYYPSANANTDMDCTLMNPENEKCLIQLKSQSYSITAEGTLTRDKDHKTTVFSLPANFSIESVQFKAFNNKIIFTFSITDGDTGSIFVTLFNEDEFNFEWKTELFAFNTSPVLIHNNSIYLGGIGVVAKLDLYDGRIIWRHTGLYNAETQAFNSFEIPVIKNEYVIFREQKVQGASYPGVKDIHVLDKTGKIIKK